MANIGKIIGDKYKTYIPDLTDDADIQQAIQMYHFGQPNYDPNVPTPPDSVEGWLDDFQDQIDILVLKPDAGGEVKSTQPTTTVKGQPIPNGYIWVDSSSISGIVPPPGAWSLVSTQTTSYTLASNLSDASTVIQMNSSSPTTITIITDATGNYPIGTQIGIIQINSGQVTIAGAVGVTINGTPGLKLRAQWSFATLLKRSSNSWLLYGDISA